VTRIGRFWVAPKLEEQERARDKFLRPAAMWLYAYEAQDELLAMAQSSTWSAAIDRVKIPQEQAELIDQIPEFADPEVIEEPFVTCRLSQLSTQQILAATRRLRGGPDPGPRPPLYAAFLHQ